MGISAEKSRQIHVMRKKQILEAALQLFYDKGYTNTKVEDIAKAAGISKGLVFRYFPTKLDIFKGLGSDIDSFLQQALDQPSPTESIQNLMRILIDPSVVDPAKIYILTFLRGELPADMEENIVRNRRIYQHVLPVVVEGQRLGEFRAGDPSQLTSIYLHFFLGVFSNVMHDRHLQVSLPDMDLAFQMLLAQEPR